MDNIVKIVAESVVVLLYALQFLMFGRAIISWFPIDEDNKFAQFLFVVTEPFVYPVRQILSKIEMFSNSPIDMSFMFAMIILIILTTVLSGTI